MDDQSKISIEPNFTILNMGGCAEKETWGLLFNHKMAQQGHLKENHVRVKQINNT